MTDKEIAYRKEQMRLQDERDANRITGIVEGGRGIFNKLSEGFQPKPLTDEEADYRNTQVQAQNERDANRVEKLIGGMGGIFNKPKENIGWKPGPGGLVKLPSAEEELKFFQAEDAKKAAAAQPAAVKATEVAKPLEDVNPMIERAGTFKYPEGSHPSKIDKTKDIYEYARNLSDKKYKEFVDLNFENSDFRGMGYVVNNNPGTGQAEFARGIDNPSNKKESFEQTLRTVLKAITGSENPQPTWKGGVKTPALSPAEATAVGGLMGTKTQAEEGAASRVAVAEERRAGVEYAAKVSAEAKSEATTEKNVLRREEDFQKAAQSVGMVTDTLSGKQSLNQPLAMHIMSTSGYPEDKVPDTYKPVMKQVKSEFNRFISDWEKNKNKGVAATAADRKALEGVFEKRLRGSF